MVRDLAARRGGSRGVEKRPRRMFVALRRVATFPVTIACGAALLAGAVTYVVSPKPYEMRASLFAANPRAANPFIAGIGRGQFAVSEVVERRILADASLQRDEQAGKIARFSLTMEQDLNEPILHITVTASDTSQAVATLRMLISRAQEELAAVQRAAGAPPDTFVEYTTISSTPLPERIRHDAIQRAIEIFLVVFLLVYLTGTSIAAHRRASASQGLEPPSAGSDSSTVVETRLGDSSIGREASAGLSGLKD